MATTSAIHPETGTSSESTQDKPQKLHDLTTESSNEASMGFDTKSALEIARIINHEDSKIAAAVKKSLPEIALVIDMVARSLREGGRLIYVGAGSSGRIAGLDSSECPPTFSTPPQSVQYIMAGGPKALASAVEVNEDSTELGQRDIARHHVEFGVAGEFGAHLVTAGGLEGHLGARGRSPAGMGRFTPAVCSVHAENCLR